MRSCCIFEPNPLCATERCDTADASKVEHVERACPEAASLAIYCHARVVTIKGLLLVTDRLLCQGILVSPRMVEDHYSSTLTAALRSAMGADDSDALSQSLRYFPPTPAAGPGEGDGTLPV